MQTSTYIRSVAGFLAAIREHSSEHELTLFRGQPNRRRSLLPAIARQAHAATLDTERQVLDMFRHYGGEDVEVAGRYHEAAGTHSMTSTPSPYWHLLAQAQQFGLKTRLLEWSSNPLIALWFACQKAGAEPYVYLLNASKLNDVDYDRDPFELTETRVFPPTFDHATHPQLAAQKSWYTIHPSLSAGSAESADLAETQTGFVPLEKEAISQGRLVELPILPSMKTSLLAELASHGIDQRSVSPGLAGLCQHLNSLLEPESRSGGGAAQGLELSLMKNEMMGQDTAAAFSRLSSARQTASSSAAYRHEPQGGLRQYRKRYSSDFDFD
ncbi:FRG domain-containing protein [Photobacterium ganghwense]|uniref:FRG domain-containing protein n=1 Tax=Photobacterium ganghwense TaxID=320778 RepID=UPI001C2D6410|nr:FRG domain-containing protein [Photobacterium ganghwense]MBV1840999.1 FRG domain-containing protein [Photobacterium ganghwense]